MRSKICPVIGVALAFSFALPLVGNTTVALAAEAEKSTEPTTVMFERKIESVDANRRTVKFAKLDEESDTLSLSPTTEIRRGVSVSHAALRVGDVVVIRRTGFFLTFFTNEAFRVTSVNPLILQAGEVQPDKSDALVMSTPLMLIRTDRQPTPFSGQLEIVGDIKIKRPNSAQSRQNGMSVTLEIEQPQKLSFIRTTPMRLPDLVAGQTAYLSVTQYPNGAMVAQSITVLDDKR